MVEQQSQRAPMSLGDDLVARHIHARSTDTAASDRSPRVRRRLRAKTSMAEVERLERGRTRVPEPPRLRMLHPDPAEVPVSEGSVVPSTSPRSGSVRVHPYIPVGDTGGSSSFEYVPSNTNRAASEIGLNESMEVTPVTRPSSSPSLLRNPRQVMSPNLVAGRALDLKQMSNLQSQSTILVTLGWLNLARQLPVFSHPQTHILGQ